MTMVGALGVCLLASCLGCSTMYEVQYADPASDPYLGCPGGVCGENGNPAAIGGTRVAYQESRRADNAVGVRYVGDPMDPYWGCPDGACNQHPENLGNPNGKEEYLPDTVGRFFSGACDGACGAFHRLCHHAKRERPEKDWDDHYPRFHPVPVRPVFSPRLSNGMPAEVAPMPEMIMPEKVDVVPRAPRALDVPPNTLPSTPSQGKSDSGGWVPKKSPKNTEPVPPPVENEDPVAPPKPIPKPKNDVRASTESSWLFQASTYSSKSSEDDSQPGRAGRSISR